jgi:hypothetical protein
MTNKEAMFLLGSCRPNGADASDPEFARALEQAARDPALAQWLENERRVDSAIAAKLKSVTVPPDLRSRILTGGRVSRPARFHWPRVILAMAAVVAICAGIGDTWYSLVSRNAGEGWEDQALATLSGLVSGREAFDARSPNVAELQQWLRSNGSPVTGAIPSSLQRLASLGCKVTSWRGHTISIICFHGQDGALVHLAMTDRSALSRPPPEDHPIFKTRDGWNLASWSHGDMAMMLITKAPESQLRTLLALL